MKNGEFREWYWETFWEKLSPEIAANLVRAYADMGQPHPDESQHEMMSDVFGDAAALVAGSQKRTIWTLRESGKTEVFAMEWDWGPISPEGLDCTDIAKILTASYAVIGREMALIPPEAQPRKQDAPDRPVRLSIENCVCDIG